jgi:alpha-beta hydrolase superfamily lysophospholipase
MRDDRFTRFPAALAAQSRTVRLGNVPVLLIHPNWRTPAPLVLWLHGRTVSKELDPGRYLRWMRAGIATCAIDLPGHGERYEESFQSPRRNLDLLQQVLGELDVVLEHLADPRWGSAFDLDSMAIGGMSGGGMAALRRLCDPHPFRCAAVEATTGNLLALYAPDPARPWTLDVSPQRLAVLDPMQNLAQWRAIPLLAVHSETDRVVPWEGMREFLEALQSQYSQQGADPAIVQAHPFPSTGAPEEHMGFGRHANDAKNAQTAFFRRWLVDDQQAR